ncbi:MAG: acylneuraminate cytidylyltransferase family protein [Bacteroidetes bacterium]|nr:acylneuraminate cytidylyltransferase family protein [Bacteroidota bacterium]
MKVLGIITARGGSKGVPRKNIKLLAGKPLLYYTAIPALNAKSLSKVCLSTDDAEIAEVGKSLGVDVPFLRPAALAEDATPTLPVLQHALNFYKEQGEVFDAICLLQPTNPLRQTHVIDACVNKLFEQDLDSVVTTLKVPYEYNPHWVFFEQDNGELKLSTGGTEPITRRQALPAAYHREGSVYVTKANVILEQNSLYGKRVGGYLLELPCPINIDTMDDWAVAEKYFEENKVNG